MMVGETNSDLKAYRCLEAGWRSERKGLLVRDGLRNEKLERKVVPEFPRRRIVAF